MIAIFIFSDRESGYLFKLNFFVLDLLGFKNLQGHHVY